jgi:hypothetical protein
MNKNIIQDNYTFTLRELKTAWEFCYNEDITKEYRGFINILEQLSKITEERAISKND